MPGQVGDRCNCEFWPSRVPTYPHSQLAARSAAIPTYPPSGAEFRERPPSGRAQRYLPTLARCLPAPRPYLPTLAQVFPIAAVTYQFDYSVKVENKQNRPGHFRTRTGWVVGAPWARPTLMAAPSGHAWGRAAPFRRQKAVFQPKTPMAGRSKKRSRQINTIKMDHTTSRPNTLGS